MRNKEYWDNRAIQGIVSSESSVLDYEARLLQAYEYALAEIKKEVNSFFQKYAEENKIPYANARKRLTASERKGFNALLTEWYAIAREMGLSESYQSYLKELGKKVYVSRMEEIEASIRFQIEKLKGNQHSWMSDLMRDNYMFGYYNSYYNLAKGVETGVKFTELDTNSIERAVRTRWDKANYSERIWSDRDKLVRTLAQLIPQSFARGINSNDIARLLAKELGASQSRARTLVRTEINFICNQSTLDVYKAAGLDEYEYLATLDSKTSEICRSLDGQVFRVTQASVGINYPPMHPYCRSTTVAHFPDDDWDGERAARDEEGKTIRVPRKTTQEDWIKQYVPEDQQAKMLRFLKSYGKAE